MKRPLRVYFGTPNVSPENDSLTFSANPPNGLILGYTSFDEKQIKAGVRKLARILKEEI